jgi:hypothetical protein
MSFERLSLIALVHVVTSITPQTSVATHHMKPRSRRD